MLQPDLLVKVTFRTGHVWESKTPRTELEIMTFVTEFTSEDL